MKILFFISIFLFVAFVVIISTHFTLFTVFQQLIKEKLTNDSYMIVYYNDNIETFLSFKPEK